MNHNQRPSLIAALEGGGTTFLVTVAILRHKNSNETLPNTEFEILHQESIKTTSPSETLEKASVFFRKHRPEQGYDALGICTFGPVGVNPNSPSDYGKILSGSPKKEWRGVNILEPILNACSSMDGSKKPVFKVDTDVNAPALAEYTYRRTVLNKDISSLAYITVGTGVGVGLIINGKPVHGMMHPEGGHVPIVPLEVIQDFAYSWGEKCPFGGKNTVEGTASSVALTELLGYGYNSNDSDERESLKNVDDDHVIWEYAANSLACLCVTLSLTTSVEGIVLGGGVMKRHILFDKIRKKTMELLNGYLDLPQVNTLSGLKEYIAPSIWCHTDVGPGMVGALVLAQMALIESTEHSKSHSSVANIHVTSTPKVDKSSNLFTAGVVLGTALGMIISSSLLRTIKK